MNLRHANLSKLADTSYDVVIIGGGINGAVSAAALAARGVKVALIDKDDFASGTSSNSSNLAWGGIKYLESHEYLLVNKLCKSRNHLMRSYPSAVREVRFVTAIQKGFRFPAFFVYLGTLLYWLIGRLFTQAPNYLSPRSLKSRETIIDTSNVSAGFEYSDAYLYDNDARFVFNFVKSSINSGCIAANYVKSTGAVRENNLWTVTAQDTLGTDQFTIRAKVLINACGPNVDEHNSLTSQTTEHRHLFSKGVHLIVDRLTDSQRVLAFFGSDGRLFFVIPMGTKTCIGTTDDQLESPDSEVTEADRDFILSNVNRLLSLKKPLTHSDIIAERCGVRPLAVEGDDGVADWVKLSRKHAIDVNYTDKHLSIFGGKLTDCINVGEEVASIVADLGIEQDDSNRQWYGEDGDEIRAAFFSQAEQVDFSSLENSTLLDSVPERLWRRYGADAIAMLDSIAKDPSQADILIAGVDYLRCEIEYAAKAEMISTLDDFLRRRSIIAMTVRSEELICSPGLAEFCRILFGDEGDVMLEKYLGSE